MEKQWSDNEIQLLSQVLPHVAQQMRASLGPMHMALAHLASSEARDGSETIDKDAAILEQSYFRLLRLINNLSSAPQLLDNAPFVKENNDIVTFLDDLVRQAEPLAQEKELSLTFETALSGHIIAANWRQLERLVWNLLSNAFKFTPSGGKITVGLKHTAEYTLISVSDTGCGIAPELMDTIYDRWIHVARQDPVPYGLGLGLPLCRNIAQRHGGRLLLQSQEQQGTTVTVSLPEEKRPEIMLHEPRFDYAGGFQHGLMELSDALPRAAFRQKHLDS